MWDIVIMHHVSTTCFYDSVYDTIDAINANVAIPGIPFDNTIELDKLAAGFKKVGVWVAGFDYLQEQGLVDPETAKSDVPLTQILGPRVREIAEANGLVQPGDGVKVSEVKKRLRAAGITTGSARLHELTEPGLRKQPEIRRAVHRWLHAKIYAKLGRDFSLSFSFPEYAEMPGGKRLPNFLVWDKPHGVKNGRMASANDLKRSDRAAVDTATAAPDGEADGES